VVTVVLIIAGTLVGALCTACAYETQSAPLLRSCGLCGAVPGEFCTADGEPLTDSVHYARVRP
jgi:hypothetical protein